jgi:gliding motility-associated-like protein
MKIYNRWGQKVFESNSIYIGWDGTWKDVDVSQNSYVWIIDYTDINNKQKQMRGVITLLR